MAFKGLCLVSRLLPWIILLMFDSGSLENCSLLLPLILL